MRKQDHSETLPQPHLLLPAMRQQQTQDQTKEEMTTPTDQTPPTTDGLPVKPWIGAENPCEDQTPTCSCKYADAWRCAKHSNSRELACSCECHRASHADRSPCIDSETPTAEQEQSAFEDWLYKTCPSGDETSVRRQWQESSDYADLYDQTPTAGPCIISDDEFARAGLGTPTAGQDGECTELPYTFAERDSLTAQLAALREERDQLRVQYNELSDDLTDHDEKLTRAISERDQLREENTKLRVAIKDALCLNISLPYGLRDQFEAALAKHAPKEEDEAP